MNKIIVLKMTTMTQTKSNEKRQGIYTKFGDKIDPKQPFMKKDRD